MTDSINAERIHEKIHSEIHEMGKRVLEAPNEERNRDDGNLSSLSAPSAPSDLSGSSGKCENLTDAPDTEMGVLLSEPEIPDQEDCSSDTIPPGAVDMKGKKKILVPELITMKKVLFDRYRLDMYTFLNDSLRRGRLSSMIGRKVLNRKITHEQCDFKDVTFWRIDRENL